MFITALFTRAKVWKQPRRLSTDEWLKKMRFMYTVECYWAERKEALLPSAPTWTDLKHVMLSERSQTKTSTSRSPVYVASIKVQPVEHRQQVVVTREWGLVVFQGTDCNKQ